MIVWNANVASDGRTLSSGKKREEKVVVDTSYKGDEERDLDSLIYRFYTFRAISTLLSKQSPSSQDGELPCLKGKLDETVRASSSSLLCYEINGVPPVVVGARSSDNGECPLE